MLDYQRIVDDVRSSLYSHNAEGLDFLRAAAADYSVGCDEVNERLRQCGALLRKGLRSEAIQLAEIEPKLLDAVALLDFPERDPWLELANRSGIAPPTSLMLDVAGELNEAYAVEQPLAALLQRHRLLALAHGPLSARIEVLRSLADGDAGNPVWQEDLQRLKRSGRTRSRRKSRRPPVRVIRPPWPHWTPSFPALTGRARRRRPWPSRPPTPRTPCNTGPSNRSWKEWPPSWSPPCPTAGLTSARPCTAAGTRPLPTRAGGPTRALPSEPPRA